MSVGKLQGYVERGGNSVSVAGFQSTTNVQKSYPTSTVTVYNSGTVVLSTIYSNTSGTLKANPFTSDSAGFWFFFAADGDYDVTFSDGTTTWTLAGARIVSSSTSTLAPAPSGGDDYATLQALLDTNGPLGINVTLPLAWSPPYKVSAELQIKSTFKAGLSGAGASFDATTGLVNGGSVIRATAAMRSVIALLSPTYGITLKGIVADASQFATYGVYVNSFSFSTMDTVYGVNAVLDGIYIDGTSTHFVDGSQIRNCAGIQNGTTFASSGILAEFLYGRKTTIAGTAQVTGVTAIDITGGPDLTALSPGIRKGDHVRVGAGTSQALSVLTSVGTVATATTATAHNLSDQQVVTISGCTPTAYNGSYTISKLSATQFGYNFSGAGVVTLLGTVINPSAAQYAQIESVTSTRINLQINPNNNMVVTAANQPYAVGCGDGLHDNRTIGVGAGNNSNSNIITGGVWRSNGGSGISISGLFGNTIIGGMFDFGSWYGLSLSHSDNAITMYQFEALHPYFEGLGAGAIWFGQVVDPIITSPTWSNTVYRHRGVYSSPGYILGATIEQIQFGVDQNFLIDIFNNGGTLQHRFISDTFSATVAAMVSAVNGATNGATNTPVGATALDATHGFAAGGGIVSADPGVFLLDVPRQISVCGAFTLEQNPVAGLVGVYAYRNTINVNGDNHSRLGFHTIDATGAGIALSTATIAAGTHLAVRFRGYIKVG